MAYYEKLVFDPATGKLKVVKVFDDVADEVSGKRYFK